MPAAPAAGIQLPLPVECAHQVPTALPRPTSQEIGSLLRSWYHRRPVKKAATRGRLACSRPAAQEGELLLAIEGKVKLKRWLAD